MANKEDQRKFREKMKLSGKKLFQQWLSPELIKQIKELIDNYKG